MLAAGSLSPGLVPSLAAEIYAPIKITEIGDNSTFLGRNQDRIPDSNTSRSPVAISLMVNIQLNNKTQKLK